MSETSPVRVPEAQVDELFLERWSPRAFSAEEIGRAELDSLFEAARWAPSCFNEQPWLFLYAMGGESKALFADLLMEGNRSWAEKAPVLAFVVARKQFRRNGNDNRWAAFDAGAAWMSLALAAHQHGLATHGMGGFDVDRAHEALNLPAERFTILAAVAIGRRGDPASLPDALRQREAPSSRDSLDMIRQEGPYRD